jgi:hypothetical protein
LRAQDLSGYFKTKLWEYASQARIPSEIKKRLLESFNNTTSDSLMAVVREMDEISRYAYYEMGRQQFAKNKNWGQINDEALKKQIAEFALSNMGYNNGFRMHGRKSEKHPPNAMNMDSFGPDMQMGHALNEVEALNSGMKGTKLRVLAPSNPDIWRYKLDKAPRVPKPIEEQPELVNAHTLQRTIVATTQALQRCAAQMEEIGDYAQADYLDGLMHQLALEYRAA